MDIPGAMQHIEHLPRLGDGAKEGIITALALLLAVKPHRRALGKARGAKYRAIEIERHPGEFQCHQPCDDQLPEHVLQVLDTVLVSPCQPPAQGGHIGQSSQTQRPLDQRVWT